MSTYQHHVVMLHCSVNEQYSERQKREGFQGVAMCHASVT